MPQFETELRKSPYNNSVQHHSFLRSGFLLQKIEWGLTYTSPEGRIYSVVLHGEGVVLRFEREFPLLRGQKEMW